MPNEIPLISGDDQNVILEESSLQETTAEIIQDTTDLAHETATTIEETIDVLNSTEEIEAAENAGLLSSITVKAYSNRVNSYLDKLESRFIITKDDRLKQGLQFDNPQAGLLSIAETLKNVIRKVIEWITKAFAYLFNFTDLVANKISQFISSRAGISKKLREKLNALKNTDYVFIDSKVYEDILKKRVIEFEYAIKGKLSSPKFIKDNGTLGVEYASTILAQELDVTKMLAVFQEILADKTKSRIPSIESDNDTVVIRDVGDQNRIEQMFINDRFSDLLSPLKSWLGAKAKDENDDSLIFGSAAFLGANFNAFVTADDVSSITPKTTRAIIDRNKVEYLMYPSKGLSLKAHVGYTYTYKNDALDRINLKVDKKEKPSMFIDELNSFVKAIDDATNSLKNMAKDSKDKANALKSWASKNTKELEEMASKSGRENNDSSKLFNIEFKTKLAMNVNMVNYFPMIVSKMMSSLSAAIDDGVKLIAASTVQSPVKAERSNTGSNKDGNYLLLAVPEKYNEIIDVEVID